MVGESKREGEIFKKKAGTQLFKLILGMENVKNRDFKLQISINFFNNLLTEADKTSFPRFIVLIMLRWCYIVFLP